MPERDVDVRRRAVADLGEALRAAAVAVVVTEAPIEHLERATELARQLEAQLAAHVRDSAELPSVDDLPGGLRFFGPVLGAGTAVSPPVVLLHTPEGVEGRVTLDRRFEGPAGYAHGGVAGLLLDELLGQAEIDAGRWGMTASLALAYRRPLPIDQELVLRAWVTGAEGRKTRISGTIAVAADPTTVCVTAEGLFIIPSDETYERYFGEVTTSTGTRADARYGRAADQTDGAAR